MAVCLACGRSLCSELEASEEAPWTLADLFRLDPSLAGRLRIEAEGECWIWTGASQRSHADKRDMFYGRLRRRGALWYIHRWVYRLLVGRIPEGWQVHHLCKNTLCCNPRHLETIDGREHTIHHNTEDRIAAGL